MKKICKNFLVLLLSFAMIISTMGILPVSASVSSQVGLTITEEATDKADVKKLVFNLKTPANAGGVSGTIGVFSFDNTKVEPYDYEYGEVLAPADYGYAFVGGGVGRVKFKTKLEPIAVDGNRTALAVVTYNADNEKTYDASGENGAVCFEFYFKYKNAEENDSNTFKLETDTSDGSLISKIFPEASQRIPFVVTTKTGSGDSAVTTQFNYTNKPETDGIILNGFTFTGSDATDEPSDEPSDEPAIDSSKVGLTIKEEATDKADVKKLVFNLKTPANAGGVSGTIGVFSFDNTKVEPYDYEYDEVLAPADYGYAFVGGGVGRVQFKTKLEPIAVDGNRTALAVVTYNADNEKTYDASGENGAVCFEFYFKYKNAEENDSNTFKLETDTSDGSLISKIFPEASQRIPFVVTTKTGSGDSAVTTQFNYTNKPETDGIILSGFTFTGSNVTTEPEGPKDFEGLAFENATFTYDGTAKTIAVTGAPADAEVTYEGAEAIDAGRYTVKATVEKEGYNTWTKEAVITINPAPLTVTGLDAIDKVYDGTTAAKLTEGTLSGLVARDAADQYCDEHQCYRIKCAIPMSGTFADANAGNDKAVSIETITLDGCSKDNYVLTQPTGITANITKAPITVTARDITVRTGSGFPSAAYGYDITAGALIGNDTLRGYLETNCTSTAVAGEFAIIQGTLTAGPNYDLTFVNGKFLVVDKEIQNATVNGIVKEKTYGDEGFTVTATPDSVSGLNNFTFTSSNENVATIDAEGNVVIKNAGTTTITVKEAGNADYAPFEKEWELTVKKLPITITAEKKTKKVGQADPELTYSVSGTLVEGDEITGALKRVAGEDVGTYDITIGSLAINDNYDITFVNGTFEITDKTPQDIKVEGRITERTYGDEGFTVTATPDSVSGLNNFTYTSSNENVATIDANGNVVIKNAGTTTISVKEAGNADYAPYEDSWTLTVNKVAVTITAENKTKKVGQADPELTYEVEGTLVEGDVITGALERVAGEDVGTYDITIGSLAINDNYDITFVNGTFTIADKTVQHVTVDGVVTEKTYGDEGFKITVTPDTTSNLDNFTIKSSNENVATIDETGYVTIKNAGTTTITVKEAGNADYAPYEESWTLTVNKVAVTITADNKSKRVNGVDPELTYTVEGTLVNGDAITGALERAEGEDVGTYDITIGTLVINDNYNITFVKGTFEIVDKNVQNITIADTVTEAVYGDNGFRVTITPDANSGLNNIVVASSNENVATIDKTGYVTIKNAGTTTITVKEPGNADFAPFEASWTLTVNKLPITITADDKVKKIGSADPELTYTVEGTLIGNNTITGALERVAGEEIGTYDITIGTLAINDNYDIKFVNGTFTILDKEIQKITIAEVGKKTYGDEPFALDVTADSASGLDTFTFESDNKDVADVTADGTVIINGAGEATIKVVQAGNADYAAAEASVKIVVNPAVVKVTAVDMDNKTATIEGILDVDAADVELDFDSIKTTVISTEKVDSTIITTLKVTNFVLVGERADNYIVAEDASLTTTVEKEAISDDLTTDENVTVEAAPVDDKTIIVTDVVVAPEAEVEKITIDTTTIQDSKVNTVAMPATTIDSIIQAQANAVLELILKDGSAENKTAAISFNADALSAVYAAVYESVYDQGITVPTITISVNHTEKDQLGTQDQKDAFEAVKTKSPVAYALSIVDSLGNALAAKDIGGFGSGFATLKLPYVKPAGRGKVVVSYLDDFGKLTNVPDAEYDDAAQLVKFTLGHFSEYLIYTEPEAENVSYGGGGVTKYTVKFATNGGSSIKSVTVNKNGTVKEPAAPTKEGYVFAGWYADKDLTTPYDFSTKVKNGMTIYAKWTEIEKEEPTVSEKLPFTDVTEANWYYDYVKYVFDNNLMVGTSGTTFAPSTTLTRAMFVTVLYRIAGEPATNRSIPFADVDMGSYYANAVVWAQQTDLVNGVSDTEFAPNKFITREQMATIAYRYAKAIGKDVTTDATISYTDKDAISPYALEAVIWAASKGIMNGNTDGTFAPAKNTTRAEAAAVFMRMVENLK